MRRLPLLVVLCALALAAPVSQVHAQSGDWGVTRDPFDKTVIAHYKGILAKNPHDASALAKLLEMYRRYRSVDLLKEEYGKVLDKKANDWAALVVLGRLHRAIGDEARARELLGNAVAAKTTDALSWLLIGELQAMTAMLKVGSLGNVQTETLRGFSLEEMRKIIGKMP